MISLKSSHNKRSTAAESSTSTTTTMVPIQRNSRRTAAVLGTYMTQLTDDDDDDDDGTTSVLTKDTNISLDPALLKRSSHTSHSKKRNEPNTQSIRRKEDVAISRAQSTQRRRLPENGDNASNLSIRSKSVARSRSADIIEPTSLLESTEVKKGIARPRDESKKHKARPESVQRFRPIDDSTLAAQRIGSKSVQRDRHIDGMALVHRVESKSVLRDRVVDADRTTTATKEKKSVHAPRRRKDANANNDHSTVDRKRTTSDTVVSKNDNENNIPDKQNRQSTTKPNSNEADRRRRKSSSDGNDSKHPDVERRKGQRREGNDTRPRESSSRNDKHQKGGNDKRRIKRPGGGKGETNNTAPQDQNHNSADTCKRSSTTSSKAKPGLEFGSGSSELDSQRGRGILLRKPSMQDRSKDSNSSHSSSDSTVFQFDPSHQSGVVHITSKEIAPPPDPKNRKTLVRKPSICVPDNNRPMDSPPESEEQQTSRKIVRKPSLMNLRTAIPGSNAQDNDASNSNSHSSSASTVIQFDPTQQFGVTHIDPNDDNDDCFSMASFGDSASVVPYDMENSWAAPVLAFHDSDGEELDEKPISRRHKSSTKLTNVLQRTPSHCGDSVHTKSSESNTTSSSFGRPQYYAPPLRTTANNNTVLSATTFAELMEKDQSIGLFNINKVETNTTNNEVPMKSRAKKKKVKEVVKVDADDEKSIVQKIKRKNVRSKLKTESKMENGKSQFDDVTRVERRMTSTTMNHAVLARPSDDDSDTDDLRMSNAFKPTPLNMVTNMNTNMTAYESETESLPKNKKGKGTSSGLGKYFFGGSSHSRRQGPQTKRDTTGGDGSDGVSDSEYSCSSVQSSSSQRFVAATRRLISKNRKQHALLGNGDVENDVVPFSW